ncbi:MAG: hypothetical protein KY434_03350 [Actinobacteria bacterium]|nr:hypothetical protein [Actinomycetota bacterium]
MRVQLAGTVRLRFASGAPVRAASAVARFADGWLIAQDDSIQGAWWRPASERVDAVPLLGPRDGRATFDEASGTKHLKPDLEAACTVRTSGGPAVLLLGSGSLPARTVGVLVHEPPAGSAARHADLSPLYERVRSALGLSLEALNLEGACVVGGRLRWFQRGHGRSGVASASVDVKLDQLLAVVEDGVDPAGVELGEVRRYELGTVAGLQLAVTDAVSLPDARVCVSAAAEDAPDAVADGPVAGSVLALLGADGAVEAVAALPAALATCKLEGLALVDAGPAGATLLAVADQDDPDVASLAAWLTVRWAADDPDVGGAG